MLPVVRLWRRGAAIHIWVAQERQHRERRYLDALAMLVDGYASSGAYIQASAGMSARPPHCASPCSGRPR